MGDQRSRTLIKFGKQASAFDFAAPAALAHCLVTAHDFVPPGRIPLAQELVHPANAGFPPMAGPIDVSTIHKVEQILRGLNGNTGAAIDPELTCDLAKILDTIAGTDSIDPAGAATTATGGNGAAKTLAVTEMARFPVGTVVRFTTTDAAVTTVWHRQVRARAAGSGAGNVTFDRIYSGTVDAGQTVIRAARWVFDPSVYEHVLGGFDVEVFAKMRRGFYGGMAKAVLDFSTGREAKLITSWRFTDVVTIATASPTFAAPTTGNPIVRTNNAFYSGDTQYYSTGAKVDCGGNVVPRDVDAGPQGFLGFNVAKGEGNPRPTISGTLLCGPATGEVADSGGGELTMQKGQAIDKNPGEAQRTHDIAFISGGPAGAFCYVVAPAATRQKWTETTRNGYRVIDFELACVDTGSASLFPLEVHLG